MTVLRSPLYSPIYSPIYSPLVGKWGGGFSPASLFAGGEVGVTLLPGTEFGVAYVELTGASATTVCGHGDVCGTFHCLITNRYWTAPSDAARPLYQIAGDIHWLEGDGTDDGLQVLFTITQPWERISALRQVTWTLNDRMFGGGDAAGGIVYQRPTTPTLILFSGADGPAVSPAIGADFVLTERHDGASSRASLNNDAYVTGNTGTTAPGGVALFKNSNASAFSNARCYGLIMREGTMSDAQITQSREYIAGRGGIGLGE